MLRTRETFAQSSHRPMADPATHALALFSFGAASRAEVDRSRHRAGRGRH